jgi:hypothetical protein
MVLVTHSWKAWAAGLVASLAIFAVIYLTVIQPDQNTANQTVKAGLLQTQHAIMQAQDDLSNSTGSAQAGAVSGHAKKQVAQAKKQIAAATGQANAHLDQATKLASCVTAAGTDTAKIQACQVKYTP